MTERAEMAQDVMCPLLSVTLGGRTLTLRFNHQAMYMAEVYHGAMTGRNVNYLALLNMCSAMMYGGMAAVIYGAMVAGGTNMPPAAFDAMVTMQDCLDVREDVLRAAYEALPDVAGVKRKNA